MRVWGVGACWVHIQFMRIPVKIWDLGKAAGGGGGGVVGQVKRWGLLQLGLNRNPSKNS